MTLKAWPRNLRGAYVVLQEIRGNRVRVSVNGRDHEMALAEWATLPPWHR